MEKKYCVCVDVTMAGNYYVEAENEEQAKNLVREKFKNDPYGECVRADCYIGYEITDVNEED